MMTTMLNYTILKPIYDSPNSLVYRALRNDDQQPVILKVLKADYPTPAELTRYHHEFEILSQLQLPGVIRAYELKSYQSTLLLVVEDFGGDSLKVLTQQRRLTLAELLPLLIQAADHLGQIHAADLIHQDINPNNIVCNVTTGQVKLIDFGIASRLPRENPTLKNPNQLEGTLPYLSPEQTGRMNRSLDYRTDFYSLGVTFYELLTGQLPFAAEDAMEMVHCHLAKPPVPPHQVNSLIPPVLSDLVLKLMAKNTEGRYQSAFGLKYDLEQILANLTGRTDLSGFQLAQQDISGKFHLPQQLYGRETEIQRLWQTFDRISQGTAELLLIAGYSGIGKTALVQELYKPLTAKRGHFIQGKFDQFQRNVPYSAVVNAFRHLVQQLLTAPESQLAHWRTTLQAALGSNGQVVMDVIPEVELIIGKPPAVPILPPTETQNRFNFVFQNFIKTFCAADHPLVIFLDDLQWADSASLKLLTLMMSDIPYLLLIGAYRDHEVSPVHPLMTTLEEMQKIGVTLQTLTLSPLTRPHIKQFLADTLSVAELSDLNELANLLLDKTGGNPFFLGEFVKTLYTENFLHFDYQQRRWQWDLTHIQVHNITNNVVELMMGKIQKLSAPTQHLLVRAASLGNQFDLTTLALIVGPSSEEVQRHLWEALAGGLVLSFGTNYKFVHDRVQQAAYSLIPEMERPALHWQIGQLLLNHPQTVEERLFEVVDHLNHGQFLATTLAERMQLAQLNLQAGHKAKSAMAYPASLAYLQTGQALLAQDSWQTAYSLTLPLYTELHECLFLTAQFDQADTVFQQLQTVAQSPLELAAAVLTKISQETIQGHYALAIRVGFDYCSKLGLDLSEDDLENTVKLVLDQLTTAFAERHLNSISELVDLPESTSPELIISVNIMGALLAVSFFYKPYLLNLLILKIIYLAITSGLTVKMAYPLACAMPTFILLRNDYKSGYDYGQVGLELAERFQDKSALGGVKHVFSLFILHWHEPLQHSLPMAREAFQDLVETGNLENAGHSFYQRLAALYETGENLQAVYHETQLALDFLSKTKNTHAWASFIVYKQVVLLHQGQTSHTGSFDSTEFSETDYLQDVQANAMALCYYRIYKLHLSYLFEDYDAALTQAQVAEPMRPYITGFWPVVIHNVYYSLTLCQFFTTAVTEEEKQSYLTKLEENQRQLEIWATLAPMNFQHKLALVQAERARLEGDWRAVEWYEKAIGGAGQNGFLLDEALAYELAAKFYLSHGMEKVAQTYLQEAYYRYQRWGTLAKLKHLERQYPHWLSLHRMTATPVTATFAFTVPSTTRNTTTQLTGNTDWLDLTSVMKAAQALSGEIVLENLLTKMMTILMENAGAQRGSLILESHGKLHVEAEGMVGQDQPTVLQSLPVEHRQDLSVAIIQYVARTRQSVVLNEATKDGNFTKDSYILKQRPQSVLCIPLLNQGKLTGILYLENNLTTGAFTAERVTVLNLLSTQAAIAIENARLYSDLAILNRAYERFVPREFLHFLEKDSITEVQLGDQVQKEMSILFSDIRSFTSLSEKMTPADNFKFINAYLSRMEPVIGQHHGFIDKYIGDAIMALFSGDADNAVQAGIAMLQKLAEYNQSRQRSGYVPIHIGIGINTGWLMLGTVGGPQRMDGTVISDAVNLASRIEGMTKMYGATLLITEHTYSRLRDVSQYAIREIDKVKVKGKAQPVTVYEVFDGETPAQIAVKRHTLANFEQGLRHYRSQEFSAAMTYFKQVLQMDATDQATQLYLKRSEYFQQHGVTEGWEGIAALEIK